MEIFKRLAEASKAIVGVQKTSKNQQQGFMYRSIDAIYNGIHEAMANAEIFTTTRIIQVIKEKEVTNSKGGVGYHIILEIEFTFYASDGSSVKEVTWGEAIDWGDKCINKCMAIAHKYALMQIFTIPTEDLEDPDASSPEVQKTAPESQKKGAIIKQSQKLKPPEKPKKEVSILDTITSHFRKLNITDEMLEIFLGKPLDHLDESDLERLRELANAIKSGLKFEDIINPKSEESETVDEPF